MFFLKLSLVLFILEVQFIHENAINFFFLNVSFTLSSPSSPSIYNIVFVINTPTTMDNHFEGVNALKFQTFLFLSHFLCTQITSLSLSLQIHQKN